jgi:hypothetical protein
VVSYCLTAEQQRQVFDLLAPLTDIQVAYVTQVLGRAHDEYSFQCANYEVLPSFDEHREQMRTIDDLTTRLGLLVFAQIWPERLLQTDGGDDAEAVRRIRDLFDSLDILKKNASRLAKDGDLLREFRQKPTRRRDELERHVIWHRVFQIFIDCGKPLPASRSGPVHDIIRIMHEALHAPEPSEDSVQAAIRKFKALKPEPWLIADVPGYVSPS